MTFRDLIQAHSWLEVEPVLLRLYPAYASSIKAHEQVFNDLKAITPADSDMRIVLSECQGLDGEIYIDVSGMDGTLKRDSAPEFFRDKPGGDEEESFALEFTDWSQWLSMQIDERTLGRYAAQEIIAHCLWEMTFIGYSRAEIAQERARLKEMVDEIKRDREA